MSIQWYPGHMAKARRALAKAFPTQDVIIEVLDARMPYASANPIVTALGRQKPFIKILCKSDLADPIVTEAWVKDFEAVGNSRSAAQPSGRLVAIASGSDRLGETKHRVPELCRQLAGRAGQPTRPLRAMVVGIPNVGKSTLINLLLGRKIAKVGDEPAVTRQQQVVELADNILLSDNPGLLWPNITDPRVGFRLAFGGAISEAALDYEPVARYAAELLLERYPALLAARYKLVATPATGGDLLDEIGRRRGCLRKGGVVDLHKAADVLIHDFRSGAIGRISLETPADVKKPAPPDPTAPSPDDGSSDTEGNDVDSDPDECGREETARDESDPEARDREESNRPRFRP